MKAMTAYSIKADDTLALRAFSSKRAAARQGNGQHIFANVDELANSRLTSEQARRVYHAVTGKATNISERQLLSEMLFNAIRAAKLPTVDKEFDFVISSSPEEVVTQSEAPVKEEKMSEEVIEKVSDNAEEKKERKFARSPRGDTTNPLEAFGVHPDSNRAKALSRMEKKLGQMIPLEDLVIAVYGTNEKRNVSSFSMVIKGLLAIQSANDLALEIRKEKFPNKGISYGLFTK